MKLLHFADLHLDAPFAWASLEGARLRRRNRRQALTRILELASIEGCDAILAAGDLFELDRVRPDTLEFLRSAFAEVGIRSMWRPGTTTGSRRAVRIAPSDGPRTSTSSPMTSSNP